MASLDNAEVCVAILWQTSTSITNLLVGIRVLGKMPVTGRAAGEICEKFTDTKRSYQIRHDKKSGILVSPKEVTVQ